MDGFFDRQSFGTTLLPKNSLSFREYRLCGAHERGDAV
jgi:hypothetical protein